VEARYQAVARFAKPHGLKGEAIVYVLTDAPDDVFVEGRQLMPVDDAGRAVGAPLTIERARAYHRRWLIKFQGVDHRTPLESWGPVVLGIEPDRLAPPQGGGLRSHEIPGAAVTRAGVRIGTATGLLPVRRSPILVVDVDGREVLVPFQPPIVVRVDRERREIEIDPPEGLLEL